jgi:multidrug efflux pump
MAFFRFILERGRIFTLLAVFLPLIAGTYAYKVMPKEGDPEISAPHAIIITPYPGASPAEVESLITNPMEEELSGLKNVDETRSSSAEGVSVVVVDFEVDADLEESLQRVREKVSDAQKELPDDAEESTVEEINFSELPIILVSIAGDMGPIRLRRLAMDAADELELAPGVLSVDVAGGRTREIQIYLDPSRLERHGLDILDVFAAVKRADVNVPAGRLETPGRRFVLRTLTEIKHAADYEAIPVIRRGGRVVRVRDVGVVVDGHSEDVSYSRVDGKSSVSLAVKKRAGANILETSESIRRKMAEIGKKFPAGVAAVVTAEQAKYIRQDFSVMNDSAVFGLIIVICVLYFAMGFRNAVITSLSIPLSLLLTFIFLNAMGMSNNNMVRFSLVLCIGLLVDNAIIVVENIYHHYQSGKDKITAVIEGASEIALPVISATLTTMAAFLPMLLMTGVTGEYMGFLPKTVSIALLASLAVALVANPLILARFMRRTEKKGQIADPEDDLRRLKRLYVRAVSFSLNHRFLLVGATVLGLVWVIYMMAFKKVEVEMFPEVDFDYIYITIETPAGTHVDITDSIARQVEKILDEHVPEATQVVSTVGARGQSAYEITIGSGGESHWAEVTLELQDGKEFKRASHKEIQRRLRPFLDAIPGALIRFRPLQWGPPTPAPVVVNVIGPEIEVLRGAAAQIKKILASLPGAIDIRDDFSDAPPELNVRVDRAKAALLGISMETVAMSLRAAAAGLDVREIRDELDLSRTYDLRIRYAPEFRTGENMLENFRLRSDSGALVPLANIAEFERSAGISEIRHVDRRRVVRITAQNEGVSAVELAGNLKEKLKSLELPEAYTLTFGGHQKETEESFGSLKLAYMIAFILIFALLVTQFNSYLQPFAIMTALPLSVVGAVFGLWVTGNKFSIMSFVGLVGLTGIVVNDSIVLVDCVNRMRKTGLDIFEAIIAAGRQRLRPIISTTLSTIGGILMLTLIDELWEGLGVVIIFGLAFATVLTLIVVPVMYSIFEDLGYHTVSALRGRRWDSVPEGAGFFYTRGRNSKLWVMGILVIQIAFFIKGGAYFFPEFLSFVGDAVHRAPSLVKLGVEVVVFYIGALLRLGGILLILLAPAAVGLVFLMGRKAREGYYVDILPSGLTLCLPAEKLFIPGDEIEKIKYSRFFCRITIRSDKRNFKIRKVLPGRDAPEGISLRKWLMKPGPPKSEIKKSMDELKTRLENMAKGR